jgi:TolB-like protein
VNSFFRELKQRRVYRVAIGYAVVAWLVIQVGSTVLPAFQVSPAILKALIVMVALGFPVALVLAWAFDVTPSGIEKTPDGLGSGRAENRRNGWVLAATGLLVAALIIGGYWLWHPWRIKSSAAEKSIAVLPLENLSDDKENAFFADGVQDDLLSSLTKIKELKVISRSSVMGYRNAATRNLREIGQQLGVSHLLEGSVRRLGDRVLVNVSLIDTRTERHIWVEHYDRTLASSLTLQAELATEIAGALRATLSPEEKTRVEEKPTENADAYVLYLRARDYQTRPTGLLQDYQIATSLYTQALNLDPSFALAHARLSETLSYTYLNFQPTAEVSTRARAEAEEALRLRPNSGEGNLARALYLYRTEKDYEAALAELKIAAGLLPGDAEIDFFSGAIRRRQGQWNESLASMQRALAGDPRSVLIAREILLTQSVLRDWPAAARAGDRAVALAPDLPLLRVERSYVDVWFKGNLAPLRTALAAVPPGVDPDGEITLARFDLALLARDFSAAERAVAAGAPETVETVFGAVLPKSYLLGCIALAKGEVTRAKPLFESAGVAMEKEALAFPRDPFRQAQLGLLYSYLGRKEDSLHLGRLAVELMPESKDAYNGPSVSGLLALIYARSGESGQALLLIERLLKLPGPLSPVFEGSITLSDLRLRWQWDPLRKDPRFQKIVTSNEPKTLRR